MNKSALRQHLLAQRQSLSAENVTCWSLAITNQFLDEFLIGAAKSTLLHTFLPIVRQNEVNTWPIIHRIWQHFPHVQVAVSVTDTTINRLSHYVLTPATPLVENRWGIPEPQPVELSAIASGQVDVVLVPLLAFDRRGHRVGYGKGYYDRFLTECRPDCLRIGLSLFEPVEDIADVAPTDIQLNACVTPEQIWLFNV